MPVVLISPMKLSHLMRPSSQLVVSLSIFLSLAPPFPAATVLVSVSSSSPNYPDLRVVVQRRWSVVVSRK